MHKLARFSVKFPTTILMIVLAIILLGIISFDKLGIDLLPDMNSPRLFIEVTSTDRPPGEIERLYVTDVEALASRQKRVQNVSSVIRVGQAMVTVEYTWGADMDEAFLDLQKSLVNFIQGDDDAEITVSQHDPNAAPVMLLALSHPEISDLDELRRSAENIISNELVRLEGIAAVEIIGDRQKHVEIIADPYTLEAYGLTIEQVAAKIQSFNRNMSGGSIVEMGRRYVIKGVGEFQSIEDIRNLIVTYKTDESVQVGQTSRRVPVYLREIASIDFALTEPENIVRVNGIRCIGLELYKERKFNTISAVETVVEELETIRRSLPGYKVDVIQDQGRFIQSAVNEVEQTGLIGIILAVIVLYVFLRRIGVTAVISIAIPVSVVATFNLMYFNDLSLNIMTLGGLALGAGMLVDNAIVVMENIFRHIEQGKSLKEAAVLGTGQVGGAITSSTLTTIVVFLPIVYLHGAAGELFKEQAWTVAFSLISSLFVAILVIPVLASRLLKPSASEKWDQGAIQFPRYRSFLEAVIEKRRSIILGAFVLIVLTAVLLPLVGSEFIPRSDQGELTVNLTLPEGTSLERTASTAAGVEAMILENLDEEIASMYTRVGPSSGTSQTGTVLEDENNASIYILLERDRSISSAEVIEMLHTKLNDIPDLEFELLQQQTALQMTLGTDTEPLSVEVRGEDLDQLESLTDSIKARIQGNTDLMNLETSFEKGRPEVDIHIDRTVAADFSLTVEEIGSQIRAGLYGTDAGQMEYRGDYGDITIRKPDVVLSQLADMLVATQTGRKVALSEVADISISNAPREILRNNQTRIGRVTAQVRGDKAFNKVVASVESQLRGMEIPPEYDITITGEEQKREEAFGNLLFALLLAVVLVYMVMAAQFESLIHPFVIILTLPLAAVGAVIALFILGMPFNIMSYIGIIMLAGIAVNDSIILVDATNQLRRSGLALTEAILTAGQMRIRPIVMTSVTTILALLPLTIGVGEGASLRAPMAVAVVGGLVTSTLLTLVVIPAVYHVLAGRTRVRTYDDNDTTHSGNQ